MHPRRGTQALYLALAGYPILLAFVPVIGHIFALTGQDPALRAPATVYAQTLLFGGIFTLVRTALSSFFVGIGRTRITMVANIFGTLVTIPLNYVLIFGHFGLPALGIEGAALGTIGGGFSACALLWTYYVKEITRGPYKSNGPCFWCLV